MTSRRYAREDPKLLKTKKNAAILSLTIGLLLLVVKIAAYLLTGSTAVLSDAAESVVHTFGISFAVYSIFLSSTPEDESHPYGHGKVEFLSAGIEGALIILAAVWIIFDATRAFIEGRHPQALQIGLVLTLFASVVTLALGLYLIRVGKRSRSLTLIADGRHILTDSFTSFAVVAGLSLVAITGMPLFDPLFAIGVAFNITLTGGRLVRQAVSGLMDEADMNLLNEIAQSLDASRTASCIELHRLRAWQAGDTLHVDAHLTVPRYYTVEKSHGEMKALENGLATTLDRRIHLLLHLDPCADAHCFKCEMPSCAIRTRPFESRVAWVANQTVAK